ncbi:MAG: AraC family transcriptional regulator [Rhizonema sp. PD37]|nr:AraC family transcriptional regulator [Rhizonema sp. PD37]
MLLHESLHAYESLCGTQISCSWIAGWRSLLLRSYVDPLEVEDMTTMATSDHLIVLVTAGSCEIESYDSGRWRSTIYRPGHLGMTSPDQVARLRWKSNKPHHTLHLHLPSGTIETVAEELVVGASYLAMLPNLLSQTDPVIATTMLGLESAVQNGAPDLYAETAAHFLAVHLLTRHARMQEPRREHWRDNALRKADTFMQEHLSGSVSLSQLANAAGLSPFQLLRASKAVWGETPLRRLTRLRMEFAKRLLEQNYLPITEIAFECGYSNPSHFATAFRRHVGVTPMEYRQR